MGIYLPNMEMPKDCLKCPFCLFVDGYWKCLVDGSHADFGGTCRPQNCPLVQVHTPHGRLIEDVAVREQIDEWLDSVGDVVVGRGLSYYGELLGCIEDAPTVIPAEPAEEG